MLTISTQSNFAIFVNIHHIFAFFNITLLILDIHFLYYYLTFKDRF